MTLRALARILLARFGVEVKSVAAAAPGSECRASGHAAGAWGRGVSGEPHLLWAEWEKETRTSRRGRQVIPKVRLSLETLCIHLLRAVPTGLIKSKIEMSILFTVNECAPFLVLIIPGDEGMTYYRHLQR